MRRLRFLTHRHRAPSTNRALGLPLAFNAGAVNAGGFLVLHMYTSHMTGFASQLSDGLVMGDMKILLNALGAILSFLPGAAVCAILVNWARQRRLHSVYAPPLLLEAALMFPFGLMGAITLTWATPFAVPLTVLLLSFSMACRTPWRRRRRAAAYEPPT
ncbi:putative membrane protein [Variovorax sp. PBL-E5]|nr:putative membrane protein [Variovorax sp. PBL-E5]